MPQTCDAARNTRNAGENAFHFGLLESNRTEHVRDLQKVDLNYAFVGVPNGTQLKNHRQKCLCPIVKCGVI